MRSATTRPHFLESSDDSGRVLRFDIRFKLEFDDDDEVDLLHKATEIIVTFYFELVRQCSMDVDSFAFSFARQPSSSLRSRATHTYLHQQLSAREVEVSRKIYSASISSE